MHFPWARFFFAPLPFLLPAVAIVLHPIESRQYEAAFGIQRRSMGWHLDLDPKSQVELFYGAGNDDGTLAIANMTLNAPSDLPIVLLERFESLTNYVDCNGDDGHMSLTFKSEDAFRRAVHAWSFANSGNQKFLVIANHDGCGVEFQRQIYIITKVTGDPELLTIHLASQIVDWSEIATDYKLSYGHYEPHRPSIRGRQVENSAAQDLLQKRAGNAYTAAFPVNAGAAGKINIFNDGSKRMKVDCTDCFSKGHIRATFDYEVKNLQIVALTLFLSPQDLSVSGTVSTTFSSQNLADQLGGDIDLLEEGIPGAGVTLLGVVNVGLVAKYQVGVIGTFKGSGSWDTQIKASVSDQSLITIDAIHPEKSKIQGWNLQVSPPVFSVAELENEASFSVHSQPKLSFGAQIKDGPALTVAISIPLPAAEIKLTPTIKAAGAVCLGSSSNAGVVIKTSLSSGVKASVELPGKGSIENDIGAPWEKVLGAQCIPLPSVSRTSTGSTTQGQSALGKLGDQVVQVATKQLGNVLGGLFNSKEGSGTSTTDQTSQTSGTSSSDDDVRKIIEETLPDPDSGLDTFTTTPNPLGTTESDPNPTTTEKVASQDSNGSLGISQNNQDPGTATEGEQTPTSNSDEVARVLEGDFGSGASGQNPAPLENDPTLQNEFGAGSSDQDPGTPEVNPGNVGTDQVIPSTDQDVNPTLDRFLGTPENDPPPSSNPDDVNPIVPDDLGAGSSDQDPGTPEVDPGSVETDQVIPFIDQGVDEPLDDSLGTPEDDQSSDSDSESLFR